MAPLCFVVLEICASAAPEMSFSASHSCSDPFSRPPAMMPRGCVSSGGPHARSWNLPSEQQSQHIVNLQILLGQTHFESTAMLAMGCSSSPCSWLSRLRSHNSSFTSSEKLSSTAPARVPVTKRGFAGPEDQANAAVRGISLNRTMLPLSCGISVVKRQWELRSLGGRPSSGIYGLNCHSIRKSLDRH